MSVEDAMEFMRLNVVPFVENYKIHLESRENDGRRELVIPGDRTIRHIKEIYCEGICASPDDIILWWCGEDLADDLVIEQELGWRDDLITTFPVEDRALHGDRLRRRQGR